ncbi:MAG: hypothetical protein M1831_002142 [Alyxoria varia]|nr:MAG: hypothetical protein M1831_002142 [Alyxoria varia]
MNNNYFEGQSPRWPQHGRQPSWDPSQASSRSGTSTQHPFPGTSGPELVPQAGAAPMSRREEHTAFTTQFEGTFVVNGDSCENLSSPSAKALYPIDFEVARANENLAKSARSFGGGMYGRRESMPMPGTFARQFNEFDPRMGAPRHHSVSEFEGMRGGSSHASGGLQGYIANQRFPSRPSEADQALQAKRKAAAQRERELRNYHQEQQYNRNVSGAKSERSMSPGGLSEEERRELIARQHRALYGNDSNLYVGDGSSSRQMSQDARVLAGASSGRGSSPLTYESFGNPSSASGEGGAPLPVMPGGQPRSRSNSNASPATNTGSFAMYEPTQPPQNQTSSSSPGGSPTRQGSKPSSAGVAPIGTRPLAVQGKRNTPPMPSPLGYGYPGDRSGQNNNTERSQSSASNPTTAGADKQSNLGWNSQGGWGSNKMQASVWG